MKKLIIFDLDGTLAESKTAMTLEMADKLESLLKRFSVAVISGGSYDQFQKQFLKSLPLPDEQLEKLFIFPTCATSFYRYENKNWNCVYAENLTEDEKKRVRDAFSKAFEVAGFRVPKQLKYGEIIEDRGSQITFSALGQQAPLDLKKRWDPQHMKRLAMIDVLMADLPEFEIRSGGTTSIDITRKGIDKAYGIRQIEKYLGFSVEEMIFVGDQVEESHGNDFPITTTGVEYVATTGPERTQKIIDTLLEYL